MYRKKMFITIYNVAFLVMSWMFALIFFTAVLFFIKVPVSAFHCLAAVLVALLMFWKCCEKEELSSRYWLTILMAAVLIIILIFFSTHLFMNAWDSNAYHKQAIGLLKNGWNPLYQSAFDFEKNTMTTKLFSETPLTWAEVYPKASWYFGAVLYKMTGNIESGKAYTLISMFVLFGVSANYLSYRTHSVWKNIAASIIIAANPIAMAQFRCFYLDGFACNILLILMIELFAIEDDKYLGYKRKSWLIIIMSIVIGCNLKTSILMFNIIICVIYIAYKFLKSISINEKKMELWRSIRTPLGIMLMSGIVGVVVVGAAPYITNILRYGNLFYKTDEFLDSQISGGIYAGTFLTSLFGKMCNAPVADEIIKIPFMVYKDELEYYALADTRMSGMGVLFSGIFCLSVFVILVLSVKRRSEYKTYLPLYMCIGIFICAMLTPMTSQHRYIGFLFIIPATAISVLVDDNREKRKKLKTVIVTTLLIVCLFNIVPWGMETAKSIENAEISKAEMVNMQEASREETVYDVCLINPEFVGLLYNLQDYDINYNYLPQLSEQQDISGVLGGWVLYRAGAE